MPTTRSQVRRSPRPECRQTPPQLHVSLGLTENEHGRRSFRIMAVSAGQGDLLKSIESNVLAMESNCNRQRPSRPNEAYCTETDFYESNRDELTHVLKQQIWRAGPDDRTTMQDQRTRLQEQFKGWVEGIAQAYDINDDQVIAHESPESMGQCLAELKSAGWSLSRDMPSRFDLSSEVALKSCPICSSSCGRPVQHRIDDKILTDLNAMISVMIAFPHHRPSANALQCLIVSRSDRTDQPQVEMKSALQTFKRQRPPVHNAIAEDPLAQRLSQASTASEMREILTALSWRIEPFCDPESAKDSERGHLPLLGVPPGGSGYMASERDAGGMLHYLAQDFSRWIIISSLSETEDIPPKTERT